MSNQHFETLKNDIRPEPVRGRYYLPDPVTGEAASWQRVTNFVGLYEDRTNLEAWLQRSAVQGFASLAERHGDLVPSTASSDVRGDRGYLDSLVKRSLKAGGTRDAAEEGTRIHSATEEYDLGLKVDPKYLETVHLYGDLLDTHGLSVVDGMIERVTVNYDYVLAGKFDRIYRTEGDGLPMVGDIKTGRDLSHSIGTIAAQLAAYADGINECGVWDGREFDPSVGVSHRTGLVIHLPADRFEASVVKVDLEDGRLINKVNARVRDARAVARRVKLGRMSAPSVHGYWHQSLVGAGSYDELVSVARRAKALGQWSEPLADHARKLAERFS